MSAGWCRAAGYARGGVRPLAHAHRPRLAGVRAGLAKPPARRPSPAVRAWLAAMCASRVGTGCRYPLSVARTTATAPSRSTRCPGDTNTGFARAAVRSTTPTVLALVRERRRVPGVRPRLVVLPDQPGLRAPDARPVQPQPEVAGEAEPPGVRDPLCVEHNRVRVDANVPRPQYRRGLAERQQPRHIRELHFARHDHTLDRRQVRHADDDDGRVQPRRAAVVGNVAAGDEVELAQRRRGVHPGGQLAAGGRRPPSGSGPSRAGGAEGEAWSSDAGQRDRRVQAVGRRRSPRRG